MTGPREWRHASVCASVERIDRRWFATGRPCTCGLSAVRDAIAAGHRVVIGPDGVEGRLEKEWQGYTPVPVIVPLEEPSVTYTSTATRQMTSRLSAQDRAVVADLRRAWTEAAHAYPGDRAVDDIFTLLDLLDSACPPEKESTDG